MQQSGYHSADCCKLYSTPRQCLSPVTADFALVYSKSDQKDVKGKVKKPKIKKDLKDQDLDEDEAGEGWKEVTGKGGVPVVTVGTRNRKNPKILDTQKLLYHKTPKNSDTLKNLL